MVFVSSIAGLGARKGGMLAYGAAKAALNHLVRSAAHDGGSHDLGESPYVPAIAGGTPSPIDHPLTPQGTPC